jgi:bifunctional DNA-binding transcriptional regulator/antitoxin component of YhaV-PrlF toxin-antitoxin module
MHWPSSTHRPEFQAMTFLTVTATGQVTFRKEVLQHLGIQPGDKIELQLLPNGQRLLKAARSTGTIADFIGLLEGRKRQGGDDRVNRRRHSAGLGRQSMRIAGYTHIRVQAESPRRSGSGQH